MRCSAPEWVTQHAETCHPTAAAGLDTQRQSPYRCGTGKRRIDVRTQADQRDRREWPRPEQAGRPFSCLDCPIGPGYFPSFPDPVLNRCCIQAPERPGVPRPAGRQSPKPSCGDRN